MNPSRLAIVLCIATASAFVVPGHRNLGLVKPFKNAGPPQRLTQLRKATFTREVASDDGVITIQEYNCPNWLDRLNHRVESGLGSFLLLGATALSIGLANSKFSGPWIEFWNQPSILKVGEHALTKKDFVNEGLMALFFFNVGLEIKKEIVDGSLSSIKSALLPCIGALGGMVVPMAVYALINLGAGPAGSMAAVTVPMATDIAFAMGVYGLSGQSKFMPPAVATFLLTLATVDDLGAILVIATCFASHINLPFLAGAAALQAVLFGMAKNKVKGGKAYLATGVGLWYCLLRGGINADIAGVLAGLSVHGSKVNLSIIDRLVKRWTPICGLAIMPIFALANTAIPLSGAGGGGAVGAAAAGGPVALGIFAGLLLGKPLGIMAFSWLGVKLGVASYPPGMDLSHLAVIGALGGIGFTMCIFLIEQALPVGPASTLSKLAVIAASAASVVLAQLAMRKATKIEPKEIPEECLID